MFKVIFKAEIADLDMEYHDTAERLRKLAMEKYGCTDFMSWTEGTTETAISYWPTREHIKGWARDPEHIAAQNKGKNKWYSSYATRITEVESVEEISHS